MSTVLNHIKWSAQSARLKASGTSDSREESNLQVSAILLMNAGLITLYESTAISFHCPWCDLELKDIHPSHSPLAWHRAFSSKICSYLRNNKSVNDKDLGIQFPEATGVLIELSNVLPRTRGVQGDVELRENSEEEMHAEHLAPAGEGHVTLLQSAADLPDSGEENVLAGNDELMKSYRSNTRLQNLLHKIQIDTIRKPTAPAAEGDYRYERNRRATFANFPRRQSVPPKILAASGFIFTGVRDVVECFYCKLKLDDWSAEKIPNKIHQEKSPSCHLIQGLHIDNIPDIVSDLFDDDSAELRPIDDRQMSIELGIITDSTKHPDFAVESRREATFLTWPSTNDKLASEMIENFMYYTGTGDTVCCFYCGVEMSKWTSIENIWVRHARQSPNCQLLLREQGQDFVTSVLRDHGRYQEPPKEPTINVVTTRMLRPRMDSPVAQAALMLCDPDYSRDDVRNALINNIKYGQPDFKTLSSLVKAIQAKREDRRDLDRVREAIDTEPAPPVVVKPPRQIIPEREAPGTDEPTSDNMSVENASVDDQEMESESSMEAGAGAAAASQPARPRRLPTPPPMADPTGLARVMKAQLTCKICMDALVGITFLPCGHLVCCISCAPAMVQCPLCRQEVKGTVRAYLDKI